MRSGSKLIGVYPLGPRDVTVYADYDSGNGCFYAGRSEMHIGLDKPRWEDVVSIAVHEAAEFSLMEMRCRFKPTPDYSDSADCFVFHFTHPQLSEVGGRLGWFLAKLLPKLAVHYKRSRKGKK